MIHVVGKAIEAMSRAESRGFPSAVVRSGGLIAHMRRLNSTACLTGCQWRSFTFYILRRNAFSIYNSLLLLEWVFHWCAHKAQRQRESTGGERKKPPGSGNEGKLNVDACWSFSPRWLAGRPSLLFWPAEGSRRSEGALRRCEPLRFRPPCLVHPAVCVFL